MESFFSLERVSRATTVSVHDQSSRGHAQDIHDTTRQDYKSNEIGREEHGGAEKPGPGLSDPGQLLFVAVPGSRGAAFVVACFGRVHVPLLPLALCLVLVRVPMG